LTPGFPHLQDPAWLALLALVPFLLWRHLRRPAAGALRYSRLPRGARGGLRLHLPFAARVAALTLVAFALARPQLGYAWEESTTEGIDIQIAIDVSGSMGANDFKPRDRLTVAKQVVKEFIAGRPADRIGLVAFSGAAVTRAPLTTDQRMLAFLVDSLAMHTLPEGTAIGMGLANAAARLEASDAKSKVVVLITDGVNNAGEIDPRAAAAVCKGLGIRVYTIGVGTRGRAEIPVEVRHPITGRTTTQWVPIDADVDEELLAEIATATGGRTFRATDPDALRATFAEIDTLERTPRQVKRYVRYREVYQPFAWAALAFLALPLATTAARWTIEP
jgi:Ca-activated chloride channel family protein